MIIDSYSDFALFLLAIGVAGVAYFVWVYKLMKRKFKK